MIEEERDDSGDDENEDGLRNTYQVVVNGGVNFEEEEKEDQVAEFAKLFQIGVNAVDDAKQMLDVSEDKK